MWDMGTSRRSWPCGLLGSESSVLPLGVSCAASQTPWLAGRVAASVGCVSRRSRACSEFRAVCADPRSPAVPGVLWLLCGLTRVPGFTVLTPPPKLAALLLCRGMAARCWQHRGCLLGARGVRPPPTGDLCPGRLEPGRPGALRRALPGRGAARLPAGPAFPRGARGGARRHPSCPAG